MTLHWMRGYSENSYFECNILLNCSKIYLLHSNFLSFIFGGDAGGQGGPLFFSWPLSQEKTQEEPIPIKRTI